MTRVGVTGHQRLDDEEAWSWVKATVRSVCDEFERPLIGVSSLAEGADQLFAETVLELGGKLEVIVPFPEYAERFQNSTARSNYSVLLAKAAGVETLAAAASDEEGYFIAGQKIARDCDVLLAVWNGQPSKGLGGTADVVRFAKSIRRRVVHLNPVTRTVNE
jgi:hypothetical protein